MSRSVEGVVNVGEVGLADGGFYGKGMFRVAPRPEIKSYIQAHSDAEFRQGICRECAEKLYPGLNINDQD